MKKLARLKFLFMIIFSTAFIFSFYGETFAARTTVYENTITYTSSYNTASFQIKKGQDFQTRVKCISNAKKHSQKVEVQRYAGTKWVTQDSFKVGCKNPSNYTVVSISKGGWYRVKFSEPNPP